MHYNVYLNIFISYFFINLADRNNSGVKKNHFSKIMVRVHGSTGNKFLRLMVTPDVYDAEIINVVPVRRPLDVPSTLSKLGKVLSHSGCVAKTTRGYVLIEYMSFNQVWVSKVNNYKNGMHEFDFKKYHFILDDDEPQTPNERITVRQFTEKMISYTSYKQFDTFSHNCHHARYDTMKFYGMKSDNPDAGKYNLFYQGFIDYFKSS